jgi:hypothetical protein
MLAAPEVWFDARFSPYADAGGALRGGAQCHLTLREQSTPAIKAGSTSNQATIKKRLDPGFPGCDCSN